MLSCDDNVLDDSDFVPDHIESCSKKEDRASAADSTSDNEELVLSSQHLREVNVSHSHHGRRWTCKDRKCSTAILSEPG